MRAWGTFLIFLTSWSLIAGPTTEKNLEEWKEFAVRLQKQGVGVMVTPPFGKQNTDAQRARNYLQVILERIAGDLPEYKKIHVRVNLYSSSNISAFATDPTKRGLKFEWPVRKYLGLSEDGKPIYEIGFLQGMLPFLKTEDEAAAILAHELGHIVLGHTDSSKSGQQYMKWYSSQSNEVV